MDQAVESIESTDATADSSSYEAREAPATSLAPPPEADLVVSLRTLFSLFD